MSILKKLVFWKKREIETPGTVKLITRNLSKGVFAVREGSNAYQIVTKGLRSVAVRERDGKVFLVGKYGIPYAEGMALGAEQDLAELSSLEAANVAFEALCQRFASPGTPWLKLAGYGALAYFALSFAFGNASGARQVAAVSAPVVVSAVAQPPVQVALAPAPAIVVPPAASAPAVTQPSVAETDVALIEQAAAGKYIYTPKVQVPKVEIQGLDCDVPASKPASK